MNTMTKKYVSVVGVAVIVCGTLVFAEDNTVHKGNVGGYTSVGKEGVDKTYNAGYSMYSAAWPLLQEYPGHSFQSGLFGTWLGVENDRPSPIERFYTKIEGGLGWWRDTEYPTETPKFIMGGVELNFRGWANGPGAGQGRDWSNPKGKYGVAQLSPWLLWPPDGLNLKQGTCGELFGSGYLPLPLIEAKSTTAGKNVPTGDQCWTLFLNTANFKGPVAFFTPYFWSRASVEDPRLSGMFFDSRPTKANKPFSMETQHIHCAQATDSKGQTYARMAPTQYPIGPDGDSLLLHRISVYNKKALWDGVKAWFEGGDPVDSAIDPKGTCVQKFNGQGGANWKIYMNHISRDKLAPMVTNSFMSAKASDPMTFRFSWDNDLVTKRETDHGTLVTLPEYYRLAKDDKNKNGKWVVVSAKDVPAETGLAGLNFSRPKERPPKAYVTPDDAESCWKKPGPVAGPFKVKLGDGSTVTYYWYRFADQPALLNADLTDTERETLQKRVEKLHRHWTRDRDYLAPPTVGKLAEIDPALIVTPPKGMEVGYVPIATRQAIEKFSYQADSPDYAYLAPTPPMGWNSWNFFAKDIDEAKIKAVADAMVSSGMRDAGYQYLVLDDAWMASKRDANGALQADPVKFPKGMKEIGDYIHSKGLKFGIYEDRAYRTCQSLPGSFGHEQIDMATFAAWGVDYIKMDSCSAEGNGRLSSEDYAIFRKYIEEAGRPMVLSISDFGNAAWVWGGKESSQLWRTGWDIRQNMDSVYNCGECSGGSNRSHPAFNGLWQFAGPGYWNDPDMLQVGNFKIDDEKVRESANKAHFGLWCILASPLMAGNNLAEMTDTVRDILTAPEIIAVNQDKRGVQGYKVFVDGKLEVYNKPLADGTTAVLLLNKGKEQADITVTWEMIGLSGKQPVRDLWERKNLGKFKDSFTAKGLSEHSNMMLKIGKKGKPLPTAAPVPPEKYTITRKGVTSLSDLYYAWRDNNAPVYNKTFGGNPIKIDGKTFEKGFGCKSKATFMFAGTERADRLMGTVALDESYQGENEGRFRIYHEDFFANRVIWDSGNMTKDSPAKEFDIELDGYNCIMLTFEGRNPKGENRRNRRANDVLGVFADPRVIVDD